MKKYLIIFLMIFVGSFVKAAEVPESYQTPSFDKRIGMLISVVVIIWLGSLIYKLFDHKDYYTK